MTREIRSQIVGILLFVVILMDVNCYNPKTSWWFNAHISQIKEKCDNKGKEFFSNLVESVQNFKEICQGKYAKIEKEFWKSYSNITLKYMLHEHCYNDLDIRNAVLNMTNNVQHCLTKSERLKKNNKKMLMKRIFDAVCSLMELYVFFNARTECEDIMRKKSSFNNCYEKYPNVWPTHSFWPLPFIQPNRVCNEKNGLQECQWDVVRDCITFTWYTHATFKLLLSKAWSSIFCTNMMH
ncbi:uncharacterized protein LOC127288941 [Leptopilina boulardi]|uniref:uncharacterized protein LOC127288941 n=1 Tax=Leptopilina boulardi TaxID=63433 RepID=UPI0021F61083|nr:uncharacterized protein LOC127288941 [Leptopilina boulardi]